MSSLPPFVLATFVLLVIGGLVHAAFLLISYHRGNLSWQQEGNGDRATDDEPIEEFLSAPRKPSPDSPTDDDLHFDPARTATVRCPHCDALNDATYRFCRECIAELGNAS